MSIALERTTDILAWLGEHRRAGQVLCGFAMETEHMVEHAKEKLTGKHVDMIAANNVKVAGAGFGTDTNVVTLITEERSGGACEDEQGGSGIADSGCVAKAQGKYRIIITGDQIT